MKTVGLITEYNPFHKGHKYHIDEAKRITGADCAVVLMSGNFVQRGEPACFDKYLRTRIALEQGAALVLELPVVYATGSAELFASGAVSILERLGIIDSICFGSEQASVEELDIIADILAKEPELYRILLQNALKTGISYPSARAQAVTAYLTSSERSVALAPDTLSYMENILNTPNHILGIEYLKALKRQKSQITPYAITRIHAGYHDTGTEHRFYSASALRAMEDEDLLRDSLADISPLYKEYLKTSGAMCLNDFSLILGEKLLTAVHAGNLTDYADVTAELAGSIRANCAGFTDFESFISLLKSKNYTYTRISRSLLHVMLGITDALAKRPDDEYAPSYVRILGFNECGKQLLRHISKDMTLLTRVADYKNSLNDMDCAIFEANLRADNLYRMVHMNKYHTVIPNEFTRKLIVRTS